MTGSVVPPSARAPEVSVARPIRSGRSSERRRSAAVAAAAAAVVVVVVVVVARA